MVLHFGGRTRSLARIAALLLVSGAAAACSSIPDWVDPTTWIGGDSKTSDDQSSDASADKAQTPDIAAIPDKPTPPSTSDEQKQVADSLEADRTRAQYSAEPLRGGAEPAAAPPSAAPPAPEPPPPVISPQSTADKNTNPVAPGTDSATASESAGGDTAAPSDQTPTASPPPAASSDAAPQPSGAPPAAASSAGTQTAMLTPAAASPTANAQPQAVVLFPNDTVVLNAAAKAQIRNAAQAFQAHGAQGFVRVVGHSSSRTPDMPLERHLQLIFERSQERATAVARELIHDGVPAEKVLIEAVGDSQPVYYESMPQGEEGNRRAEIFLQS
jgi:outer membrane protein OmpA-like peptidoglycan-associated protein